MSYKKIFFITIIFLQKTIVIAQLEEPSKFELVIISLYEKSGASALTPSKQEVFIYGLCFDSRIKNSKSFVASGIIFTKRHLGINSSKSYYLQIPIKYKLKFSFFYLGIGAYADLFYGFSGNENNYDKKTNYGYLLNAGVQKNITKDITLLFMLNSTNNLTGNAKFSNYGAGFGVSYILK